MNIFLLIVFVLITTLMVFYTRWITNSLFNVFTIFAVPYLVMVPMNQLVGASLVGMYYINDSVMFMLLGAISAYFLGCLPLLTKIDISRDALSLESRFEQYNMRAMVNSLFIIGALVVFRVIFSVGSGSFDVNDFDTSSESLLSGPIAHVRLAGYVLMPIVMLWGIKTKQKKAVVGIAFMLVGTFASFKKNDIFCMLVTLVIFATLYWKQKTKPMICALVILVPLLFFLNYYIGFFVRDSAANIPGEFYIRQFFTYSSGSLVYDNYVFERGIRVGVSLIEKCLIFVFALPNMFLNKLFDIQLFTHQRQAFLPICESGSTSNVTDFIGYMFPSKGSPVEIVGFLMFFCILGFTASAIANSLISRNKTKFSTGLAIFLSEFLFFSFFGTFYVNPTPWESLVLSGIIPWLFLKKTWRGIAFTPKKDESNSRKVINNASSAVNVPWIT